MPALMKAWAVDRPGPVDGGPLVRVDKAVPRAGARPGPRARARRAGCAGPISTWPRATSHHAVRSSTPGHEVVGRRRPARGRVRRAGSVGDRIGVPWLAHTCGICRFCRRGARTCAWTRASPDGTSTAATPTYAVVDEAYAYALPEEFGDEEAAPLLCAGIIGYRALRRANLPEGGRLGIYGFGGSAHITAQVALARGARVHVMTRSPEAQQLALALGAASAAGADAAPPEPLDSAILFAPGRHAGAARARRARPRRHARRRRHLPQRHPRPQLRGAPLRGAHPAERDGEHTGRRRGVPRRGRPHSAYACSVTPYPMDQRRRRRCATCATTGSTGPPSWSPEPGRRPGAAPPDGAGSSRSAKSAPAGLSAGQQKRRRCPSRLTSKRCHRALGDRSWSSRLGHARRQCDQAVDR